jgi:prepilin-type N-terminal cleavage/methylation domain-containing protein
MKQRGFSLIELMMVLMILSVVMMAVFALITMAMQSSSAEQSKLDIFQEAREFMDLMSRDLRQAGYPNARNVGMAAITTTLTADVAVAVGIVKIDSGDLWFEGDVDGTGTVSVIQYHLDTSTANGCPCLKRSQLPKIVGDPFTGQSAPVYEVQVQGVRNTNIFTAYSDGVAISLPVTFADDGNTIATIDTIQATLSLEAAVVDTRTGLKPDTTLITTVKINNCSHAAVGELLSCQ